MGGKPTPYLWAEPIKPERNAGMYLQGQECVEKTHFMPTAKIEDFSEEDGGRGRNRIFNQTYFQQHAGQRMTP
jgi:hypothetical protein